MHSGYPHPPLGKAGVTSTLMRLLDPLPFSPTPGDPTDTHLHGHRGVPDCSVDHDPQHPASRVCVCVLVSGGHGPDGQGGRVAIAEAAGQTDPGSDM